MKTHRSRPLENEAFSCLGALRTAAILRRGSGPRGGTGIPSHASPGDGSPGCGPEGGAHARSPGDPAREPGASAVSSSEAAGGAGERNGAAGRECRRARRPVKASGRKTGGETGGTGKSSPRYVRLAEIGLRLPALPVPPDGHRGPAAYLLRARAVRPQGRGFANGRHPPVPGRLRDRARRRAHRQAVGADGGDAPSARRPGRQGLHPENGPPLRCREDARGGEDPPAEQVRHGRRGAVRRLHRADERVPGVGHRGGPVPRPDSGFLLPHRPPGDRHGGGDQGHRLAAAPAGQAGAGNGKGDRRLRLPPAGGRHPRHPPALGGRRLRPRGGAPRRRGGGGPPAGDLRTEGGKNDPGGH